MAEASPEEVDAFDLLKCLTHGGDMPGSVSPLDVAEKGFVRVRLAGWEGGVGWGCKEEEGGRRVTYVCMRYSSRVKESVNRLDVLFTRGHGGGREVAGVMDTRR